MPKTKPPPMDDPEQSERFLQAAKELTESQEQEEFSNLVQQIARRTKPPETTETAKGEQPDGDSQE